MDLQVHNKKRIELKLHWLALLNVRTKEIKSRKYQVKEIPENPHTPPPPPTPTTI